MTERPIIFSGDSVRAILAGTKTMTRRVVKPQPPGPVIGPEWYEPEVVNRNGELAAGKPIFGVYSGDGEWGCRCPWEVGMRLWVRETHQIFIDQGDDPTNCDMKTGRNLRVVYAATDEWEEDWPEDGEPGTRLRSPIHMPRWASRLTLEITAVRCERLQAISEADANAEGARCRCGHSYCTTCQCTPRQSFAATWDKLNGKKHPWASNPYVWAISFQKVEP